MGTKGSVVVFALSILVSFAVATSLDRRNPGDVLYSQCKNITYNGISLPNSCIVLSEGTDCSLNVALSVSGNSILSQNMDFSVVPSVCGQYSGCDICVEIVDNPDNQNQKCIQIAPKCGVFSPTPSQVGCFATSILGDLVTCRNNKCPNDCNGHGTCAQGTCTCSDGWAGDDCNATGPLFDKCQRVDALGADVCVRLEFDQCNIVTQILIEGNGQELTIYNEPYSVEDFKEVFQDDNQCVDFGVCSVCLSWTNLVLTEVEARGCGTVMMDCLGTPYNYQIGCFDDDTVVPKCFGTCPKNCSYNGYCYRGVCQCTDAFSGADCSVRKCPGDCSGHGNCFMGQCKCDEHWGGLDCSSYRTDTSSSHTTKKGVALMAILVPILLIVAVGVAAVIIWFVRRKSKSTEAKFTQLELMDDEEDHSLVDDAEK